MMLRKPKIERFNDEVLSKYQIYNSLFMTLPYDKITNTGALLPLFSDVCIRGYDDNQNPTQIIETFFAKYLDNPSEKEKNDLLFRFIQYIERQVVLFDAIEDAAFPVVNNMDGLGTMRNIKEKAEAKGKEKELKACLETFKIRPVLTAHPTQFYPGAVLGIITDLATAVQKNDLPVIKKLLAQLGKTPFFKKEKPTPFDEAVSLIWYLENVFYHSVGKIYGYIRHNMLKGEMLPNEIINLGFWPGGDRDGNPFVTAEITLDVAARLKSTILKNYYRDIRKLKRRITFVKADVLIAEMERKLYESSFVSGASDSYTLEEFKATLQELRELLVLEHQSLFVEELDDLIDKVAIFGFHFATLDIRQDSRVHHSVITEIAAVTKGEYLPVEYSNLTEVEQIKALTKVKGEINPSLFENPMVRGTLESIYAMKSIQQRNGEKGANRYIISNNGSALNVLETLAMIHLCDWEKPSVDVIPLFETIDDLKGAPAVMEQLYTHTSYRAHLSNRNEMQVIMLGFSDGTKDGGYLMANWSIYKAKEELTEMSRKYGVKVVFFDGRGGPPARGGGKTHQFYASLCSQIENEEIQLTVQGQTISSNFGTLDSSQYNLEQLLSAGISNQVFNDKKAVLAADEKIVLQELAEVSYSAYTQFKNHPMFIPYLERMSTLKYYAKTNIGSRPSKRGKADGLVFSDLRAIPFVGSWSQLKQNVPGFFGVGTALNEFKVKGEFDKVKALYNSSLFFKTLLENSMMSLTKSFFKLTAYMKDDEEFGAFWSLINDEYELTKKLLLELTGYSELMENTQSGRASIQIREQIVLPLLTIQQYALRRIQQIQRDKIMDASTMEVYEKMVTRSLFGNINASRNSA